MAMTDVCVGSRSITAMIHDGMGQPLTVTY